jgi:hypothetical protein
MEQKFFKCPYFLKLLTVRGKQMSFLQLHRILCFLLLPLFSIGQVNHKKAYQLVLNKNQVGNKYTFDKSQPNDYDRLDLVYLGRIKTSKGRVLKIVTSRWYWGLAPRGTSRIVVFNENNQYLGDYYLTMTYEVPQRIDHGSLVFKVEIDSSKHSTLITKISLRNGIPENFFLPSKADGSGHIYFFAPNLF